MLSGLGKLILAGIVVALGLAVLAVALHALRKWMDRTPFEPHRHQARVCAHCARELTPGSYPPIISSCGPEVHDCPGFHR